MLHNVGRSQHGEILTTLASLVDTGKLKPIVDSPTYTLDEVGKAHERLESGRATGKVVITI
jgi:NADPH2:quinone reductase